MNRLYAADGFARATFGLASESLSAFAKAPRSNNSFGSCRK